MTTPSFPTQAVSGVRKDGVRVAGNPREFFGNSVVAFVDLLGFADAILTRWGEQANSPLRALLRIKESPLIASEKGLQVGYLASPRSSDRTVFRPRVFTFSDSIALAVALPDVHPLTPGVLTAAVMSVFGNVVFLRRQALADGFVIRGAVEIGQSYWNQSELVGPALIRAYRLESRVARTARILVGPTALKAILLESLVTPYSLTDFLYVSRDGLVSVFPTTDGRTRGAASSEALTKLRSLREAVEADERRAEKYDELLSVVAEPGEYPKPTTEQVEAAVQRLECLRL